VLTLPSRHPWGRVAAVLAALCLLQPGFSAWQSPAAARAGAVIESVEPAWAGDAAGLRRGDLITGWRLAGTPVAGLPAGGAIKDPWELERLTTEIAPRALVVVETRRGGALLEVALPVRTSRWGITVRPALDPADEVTWIQVMETPLTDGLDLEKQAAADIRDILRHLAEAGLERSADWLRLRLADHLTERRAFERASREYRELLARPAVSADASRAGVVHGRLADLAQRQARWDEAVSALASAMALEPPDARTTTRAAWLQRRAAIERARGSYDDAVRSAEQALAIRRELAPGSWDEADTLGELGAIALARRSLDEASARYEAALGLVSTPPAPPLEAARLGFNLAMVDWRGGRLAEAERRLQSVLESTRTLAPSSADHARSLNLSGILRGLNGDLPAAERFFEQSLAIHARIDPGGAEEAGARNNVGIAAMQRGRFAEAERQFRTSLAIKERLGTPPLDRASTLGNLGIMSVERNDLHAARTYLQQQLALSRQVSGDSLEVAAGLNNLSRIERLAGEVAAAESHARESLVIRARRAPDTSLHAFTLSELGKVLEAAGRLAEASEAHGQALRIRERLVPDGSNVADSLDALGRLAARQDRLDDAAELHAKAGAIWQRTAPASVYEALNLAARGRLARGRGRTSDALDLYARATAALDEQTGSIGGSFETLADFRNSITGYYAEYVDLLIRNGRTEDAFHVSERARTRAFLALLTERDLPGAGVPVELDAKRRSLTREYERIQGELSTLSATRDAVQIDERHDRMREVRLELAATRTEITRSSTRPGGNRGAEPLRSEDVQRLLDEGTIALSYLVGTQGTHVFVLTRARLEVFEIPWSREVLAEKVQRLRRLVDRSGDDALALKTLSRELYQGLVGPAEAAIAAHHRLLVVPDGPLHALPFAALARGSQYLVEWRPVHQVSSLTVYGELPSSARAPRSSARLVAVGSPSYTPIAGHALPDLPGSRREVELLRQMYGTRATTLVGDQASETRVRERIADADILHIAVHGVVNETFPLDSALAFSTPQEDEGHNGQLQSWEILEDVRLRARLVVLSACDTAGIRESGGEGLLGLTRAFQLAGAPSVVASLWRVPDEVTPTLMREFHRHVRNGVGIDEALARAQRAMLRDPRTAHPYNWAAFVLNGRR